MPSVTQIRSSNSVSADVDRLLSPKSLGELEVLEKQINVKLQSDEPIDVEYWELLLRNVSVYKSQAELNNTYKTIIESRLEVLRQEQQAEAFSIKGKLALLLTDSPDSLALQKGAVQHSGKLDPESLLKIRPEDKSLDIIDEQDFLDKNVRSLFFIIK